MRLRFILLGLLAFVAALLVVFPATWIRRALPPQLTCESLGGSVWNGQCNGLAYSTGGAPPLKLDTLSWKLHPLALLRGRAQADLALAGAGISAQGRLTLRSGGRVAVAGLSGVIALDHSRLAALPAGWSAQAEAHDLEFGIESGKLAALGGLLRARQLRDARGTSFGDFRLQFPRQDSAPFRGALADDTGARPGPLQLTSQLTLNADQSWQLRGTVVLRPGSPPGLAGLLDQLAPADLDGQRHFSLEGTAR